MSLPSCGRWCASLGFDHPLGPWAGVAGTSRRDVVDSGTASRIRRRSSGPRFLVCPGGPAEAPRERTDSSAVGSPVSGGSGGPYELRRLPGASAAVLCSLGIRGTARWYRSNSARADSAAWWLANGMRSGPLLSGWTLHVGVQMGLSLRNRVAACLCPHPTRSRQLGRG